jgi:hypothetical protein
MCEKKHFGFTWCFACDYSDIASVTHDLAPNVTAPVSFLAAVARRSNPPRFAKRLIA